MLEHLAAANTEDKDLEPALREFVGYEADYYLEKWQVTSEATGLPVKIRKGLRGGIRLKPRFVVDGQHWEGMSGALLTTCALLPSSFNAGIADL